MSKYKYEILELLIDSKEHISGQNIAKHLNISRTAVWKVIEQLREEGFSINTIQSKGYELSGFPNVWDKHLLKLAIRQSKYFKDIYVYDVVDSTQKKAHEIIEPGSEPFIIISEEQTAGRGRFNRAWDSQGEKGLWTSLVFNPDISFRKIATFNLFISLAIAETIEKVAHINAQVKWPNDVYVNNKKVCGFLTEVQGDSTGVNHIICGIGINLNHELTDFPNDLQQKATSLKIESNNEVNRLAFFMRLIGAIEYMYTIFLNSEFKDIKEKYKEVSNIWDRPLRYTSGSKQITGRAIDILDDGILVVKDDEGHLHQFISADIEM